MNSIQAATSSEFQAGSGSGWIPLCEPFLGGNESAYLEEAVATNWVSSTGPFIPQFEQAVAALCGRSYAVALMNGTSALHLALLVAGVEPQEEVLMPALGFIAPANAVRYIDAWPVFTDIDPLYWQMDVSALEDFIKNKCTFKSGSLFNKATRRRIKAVMAIHLLGHPSDMQLLEELAKTYGLALIVDAAESLGSRYRDRPAAAWGQSACLSFNGNKIATAGGGGMVVTDDRALADRVRYLSTQAKDDSAAGIHGDIGYNYRMTNLQAAVGLAQVERIASHWESKRRIAARYRDGLAGISGITPMPEASWAETNFWLYTIRIDPETFGHSREATRKALLEKGIETRPLWELLSRSRPHGRSHTVCDRQAHKLWEEALSLPSSVGLIEEDQDHVIRTVKHLNA